MCVWRVSVYMSEYMWLSTCVNVHMYWVDVCVCMYDSVFLRVIGESEFELMCELRMWVNAGMVCVCVCVCVCVNM